MVLELLETGSGDDGQHFSCSVRIFRTPPLGVESLVVLPINPQRLLIKTLCLKARVKNNNNNITEKNPAHLAGFAVQSRPHVWKRLHPVEFSGDFS